MKDWNFQQPITSIDGLADLEYVYNNDVTDDITGFVLDFEIASNKDTGLYFLDLHHLRMGKCISAQRRSNAGQASDTIPE